MPANRAQNAYRRISRPGWWFGSSGGLANDPGASYRQNYL